MFWSQQCAQAAREKGYTIFALRFGGKCFVQLETDDAALYKSLGPSDKCENGKGSLSAIDVYRLGSGMSVMTHVVHFIKHSYIS